MKLLAIRDINAQDPLPTLGPKVAPPTPPGPPPLRSTATPGIMQRPDGKLETDLPLPPPDPLVLVKDVDEGFAADIYKKAFDARKKRIMSSPFFSGTDKSSWWVGKSLDFQPEGTATGRLPSAQPVTLESVSDDIKRAWQADLAEIENRAMTHFGDCVYYRTANEKKPAPKRLTYEQCLAHYKSAREAGRMSPRMVPGTIYPKEAIEEGLVLILGKDGYLMYEDRSTRSVVIPLLGKSGEDYFP